ncbi:unnamed protein product [Scytosiphon promiscuus]
MKFCQVDDDNVARTEAQLSRFYGKGKWKLFTETLGFSSAKGFQAKCDHLRRCIRENNGTADEFCDVVPKSGLDLMVKVVDILHFLERTSAGNAEYLIRQWRGIDPNTSKIIRQKVISEDDAEIARRVRRTRCHTDDSREQGGGRTCNLHGGFAARPCWTCV